MSAAKMLANLLGMRHRKHSTECDAAAELRRLDAVNAELLRASSARTREMGGVTSSGICNDAKHTRGPWKVAGPSAKGYLIVQGANGNGVAMVLMDSDDEEADARLIAAAPELLEALRYMRSEFPEQVTEGEKAAHQFAHAAIVKATKI